MHLMLGSMTPLLCIWWFNLLRFLGVEAEAEAAAVVVKEVEAVVAMVLLDLDLASRGA